MAAQRPGAGSLLLSQAAVRWGRGAGTTCLEGEGQVKPWRRDKGPKVSFCLWIKAVDP